MVGDEIYMNNTKTLAAIAAILIAGTLVVAGTLAASATQSAFAYQKKRGQDNSKDGNTVTIQACKQKGSVSGFDNTAEQECGNTICTHPSSNAICVSENEQAVTPVTPPVNFEACTAEVAPGSTFDVTLGSTSITSPSGRITFHAGDELCVRQLGNHAVVDVTTPTTPTSVNAIVVPAGGSNHDQCANGFVVATVTSVGSQGLPDNLHLQGSACVGFAGNV
jgi:hypothetical protein